MPSSSKRPMLYIIHGWTYTVAPWERTITMLEKQGFKVKMLHVPGLTSNSRKVWTIEDYVTWADRELPQGAVALGHSNGGRILLNLAALKPGKLSHLILLDSAGIHEDSVSRDAARSLSKTFGFLKKIPGLTRLWHKLTGASDYARAPENMKHTLSNMLESDKKLSLDRIHTPTSILWGEADTVTPLRQGEALHQGITGSTFASFPEWTHAPYLSHPAELARAIIKAYKNPPEAPHPSDVTETASISASMALRKAPEPNVPSTSKISASMAFKKASGPTPEDTSSRSASLVGFDYEPSAPVISKPKDPHGSKA